MNIFIVGKVDHDNMRECCTQQMQAQKELEQQGHKALSIMYEFNWEDNFENEVFLRFAMLIKSEAIAVLSGWHQDILCHHEIALAAALGKSIITANDVSVPPRITFIIK